MHGISWRNARTLALSAALAIALAAPVVAAGPVTPISTGATGAGAATVSSFYNVLLNTMRNGPSLGQAGRYAQLAPAVQRDFNIPYMAQLAVGPAWAGLNDAQKRQVTQAFERYVAAVYADRFDNYAGEQLQVVGEQPSAYGTMVQTRIVKSNGEPVSINYLLVNNGGRWQIGDVYLNGSISELATRRSEFASILRTQGVDGLIATLNTKTSTLVPSRS